MAASIIAPPYAQFGSATDCSSISQTALSPGAIVCVELEGSGPDDESLSQEITQMRQRQVAAPVVLRLHGDLDIEAAHLIQRVAQLHVRGIIVDGEPLLETLRRSLTAPVDLAGDVAEWLALRMPSLPPPVVELCRQIFRYAPIETEIASLLSTARARLRKVTLPPPGSWLQAARALHAALRLQREHASPIFKLAVELGYCDHSALSHQLMRTFGVHTARIRCLLGWEWLLDAWLSRRTSLVPATL